MKTNGNDFYSRCVMPRNNRSTLCALVCCCLASDAMAETSGWHAGRGPDPLTQHTQCLLQSDSQTIHDGQTKTPMRIVFNGTAFIITTRSNIDLTYPDLGLTVDDLPTRAIDHVHKATSAVFDTDVARLRSEFSKGRQVQIALGFWPSWPKTDTKVTRFSLQGFRKAYAAFLTCQTEKQ